jgi:hypothetical protein
MAGSLIKIDEEIVTSAVSSVTLTGIDSTYDVYMVRFSNLQPVTDTANLRIRFTVSGTPDTSSNYDRALKELDAVNAFGSYYSTNADHFAFDGSLSNATGEVANGVIYCFNFSNASEYSFITYEANVVNSFSQLRGRQGGGVLTVAQATDGIQFYMSSGNINSASCVLYGLKK